MKEKETVLDKIYKEAKQKRIVLTLDEFAKSIGISRATLFRIREEEEIDSQIIDRAKNLLIDTNNDSESLSMVSEPEETYLPMIKAAKRNTDHIIAAPKGRFPKRIEEGKQIPFFDTDFAAGDIEFYNGNPIQAAYTMDIPEFSGCTAFRTYGDSMAKLIRSGDILFATKVEDWKSHLEYGQIYGIVCMDKRRYLKYIRKAIEKEETHFLIRSENKEYDDFLLPKSKIKSLWLIHGWMNKRT